METGKLQNTGYCAEKVSKYSSVMSRIWEMVGAWIKVDAWIGQVNKTREHNIRHSFSEEEMKAWKSAEYLVIMPPLAEKSLLFFFKYLHKDIFCKSPLSLLFLMNLSNFPNILYDIKCTESSLNNYHYGNLN